MVDYTKTPALAVDPPAPHAEVAKPRVPKTDLAFPGKASQIISRCHGSHVPRILKHQAAMCAYMSSTVLVTK